MTGRDIPPAHLGAGDVTVHPERDERAEIRIVFKHYAALLPAGDHPLGDIDA